MEKGRAVQPMMRRVRPAHDRRAILSLRKAGRDKCFFRRFLLGGGPPSITYFLLRDHR